jgi:hypothetical protein
MHVPYPTLHTLTEAQTPPNAIIGQLFSEHNRIVVPAAMGRIIRLISEADAPNISVLLSGVVCPLASWRQVRERGGERNVTVTPMFLVRLRTTRGEKQQGFRDQLAGGLTNPPLPDATF